MPTSPDPAQSTFPIGARVHHANQLWTAGWTETQRREKPVWGWATVLEVKSYGPHRKDQEVRVRYDEPISPGHDEGWWPGWLIDEVHPAVAL